MGEIRLGMAQCFQQKGYWICDIPHKEKTEQIIFDIVSVIGSVDVAKVAYFYSPMMQIIRQNNLRM